MRPIASLFARRVGSVGVVLFNSVGGMAAHADSHYVATATASVENLQISFTDFRPDDGVAAGVRWISPGRGQASINCCTTSAYYDSIWNSTTFTDSLEAPTPQGLSAADGTIVALRTADGLRAGLSLDSYQFEGMDYGGGRVYAANFVYADAAVSMRSTTLSLLPGTEISFSGQTTFRASLNLMNTPYGARGSGVDAVFGWIEGSAMVGVSSPATDGLEYLMQPEGEDAFAGGEITQRKWSGQIAPGYPGDVLETRPFSFVIRNTGDEEAELRISLSAELSVLGDAGYPPQPTPQVPEPGTWALFLAGVFLIVRPRLLSVFRRGLIGRQLRRRSHPNQPLSA